MEIRRFRSLLLTLLAPLLLTGCFLSPGKFSSELELLRDGTFAYQYVGEINFVGLKQLSQASHEAKAKAEPEFMPLPCHDEENGFAERACNAEELAEQRSRREAERERNRADRERDAMFLKVMFGGLDPANPAAAEELAARLQRQAGWDSVSYRGDGIFDVRFALRGRLDHDFLFPVMEGMPMGSTFVQVILRKQDKVRIDAPGFAAQDPDSPGSAGMPGMGGLMAAMAVSGAEPGEAGQLPSLPLPEGTFRIVTDGEILANNTDEGPTLAGNRKVLQWQINPRTRQAPGALIRLAP